MTASSSISRSIQAISPSHTSSVHCIMCQHTVPAVTATAGALYATGRQAFACRLHMRDRQHWTTAWVAFEARQSILAPTRPLRRETMYGTRP